MRRFFLLIALVLIVFTAACGQLDQLDEISDFADGLTGGEDVGDEIEHVATMEDEEATVSTYTTDLGIDEAEDTFVGHMEDEGYEMADQEKELGYFVQFGDAGEGGLLMKDDSNYMYIYLSEGTSDVSIIRVIAPQDDYESHYDDDDSNDTNGSTDDPTLPESDVSGEDLEVLPRYEDSVRTKYAEAQEGGERIVGIKYEAEASLEDVKTFYLDEIDASPLSVEDQAGTGDEYAVIASDETREVDIGITAVSDTYVEISIQLVESE